MAFLVNLLMCLFVAVINCYEVPPAKLEAIYPKGLRVSVPGLYIFVFWTFEI